MFKTDAKLFLSANNNLNYAKTIINDCKRLIGEIELQGDSDYASCKNNITSCDVNGLSEKIETTKANLMKLDQGFAGEYMTLLQETLNSSKINTTNMTEEEMMQYNIQMNAYVRDYNYSLLYMLEKYEESGMLTPELQAQLEIQRTVVEQYDLQDKMAVLSTSSQEFIDLFKKNAEYDKKIINLDPNLTEEQKASALKEYEISFNSSLEVFELNRDIAKKTEELKQLEAGSEAYYKKENEIRQLEINYYENKGNLTQDETKRLQSLKDGIELNELYIDKEQNNGFFHPFIEGEYNEAILDKKISMGIATEGEIAYSQMNGLERAWEHTKTFSTSVVFGIGSVTETLVDGAVMLAGGIGGAFGADTQWAEDFVSVNFAQDAYDGLVLNGAINSYAAYSKLHDIGNFVGSTVGYVCLSALPGGKITMAVTGGLSAMGSSSQRALNSGATFEEAFKVGAISGAVGAGTGWLVGELGTLASSSTSLLQVGGRTLAGMGVSTLEPIVNSVAEYAIYADEMVDEDGNKIYDNIWDYYVDGGGLTNTVMAGVSGGISVGFKGLKSYSGVNKYKNDVLSTMEQQSRRDIAQSEFDAMNGEGSFEKILDVDKEKLMSSVDGEALSKRMIDNEKLVNNSITNAKNQYKAGVFDTKYTLGEILEGYKGDQMKFWSTKGYNDWKNDFGKFVDSDGNVKVYSFQDGSIGAKNIVTFGGDTSLPQGSFVMSERQYLDLLADRTVFDSRGNCINPEKLSDLTGGCNFGAGKNIIAVEQTVKLDDITLPNGSHPNAYPGWWSPGGKTVTVSGVGYCIEGIAPFNNYANGNVNIISHNSRYNTKYYTNPLTR